MGVFHGDIKDENILISTHNLSVSIIDFGSSQSFDRKVDWFYTVLNFVLYIFWAVTVHFESSKAH